MFFNQDVSLQGKYKLTSRDPITREILDQSGWSENKIMQTVECAKIIHETGFTDTPPFQVGRTDTGNYDTFENVIALTHTTHEVKPMSFGWVVANDVSKGYKVVGGGSYKFTPQTTTRGLKVNQVGIKGFSIAQVRNAEGAYLSYPITPGAEIEIDFTLTMIIKPDPVTSIPTYDEKGVRLFATSCRVNTAIDTAMLNASNYQWNQLLSRPEGGLRAFTSVSGSVSDPAVIGNMPAAPSIWEGEIGEAILTAPGQYRRRGYVSSGITTRNYIRLGVPTGVPGIFASIIFSTLYAFPVRTLTDIALTSTYTEQG